MDVDKNGSLSTAELLLGLRNLPVRPQMYILSDDLDQILDSARIRGDVSKLAFQSLMSGQVLEYVQRRATDVILLASGNSEMAAQMSTNKLTLSLLRQSERKQLKLDEEISGIKTLLEDMSKRLPAGTPGPSEKSEVGTPLKAVAAAAQKGTAKLKPPRREGASADISVSISSIQQTLVDNVGGPLVSALGFRFEHGRDMAAGDTDRDESFNDPDCVAVSVSPNVAIRHQLVSPPSFRLLDGSVQPRVGVDQGAEASAPFASLRHAPNAARQRVSGEVVFTAEGSGVSAPTMLRRDMSDG